MLLPEISAFLMGSSMTAVDMFRTIVSVMVAPRSRLRFLMKQLCVRLNNTMSSDLYL